MLTAKAITAIAIFTSDVPSPLEDERRSVAVTFFPGSPPSNKDRKTNEKRLKHGQNLKIIDFGEQLVSLVGALRDKPKKLPRSRLLLTMVSVVCEIHRDYNRLLGFKLF